MPKYAKRLLVMVVLAFPISLALMTTGLVYVPQSVTLQVETNWLDRFKTMLFFLSVSGTITAVLVSLTHTWVLRRGLVKAGFGSILLAAMIGLLLGAIVGLTWSVTAVLWLGLWGVVLGITYGLLIQLVDR